MGLNIGQEKKHYQDAFSDFVTLKDKAIAYYRSLSGPQKSTILNTLNNWGGASALERDNALLALVALLFIGLWWFIRSKE